MKRVLIARLIPKMRSSECKLTCSCVQWEGHEIILQRRQSWQQHRPDWSHGCHTLRKAVCHRPQNTTEDSTITFLSLSSDKIEISQQVLCEAKPKRMQERKNEHA